MTDQQLDPQTEDRVMMPPAPAFTESADNAGRSASVTVIAILLFIGAAIEISGLFSDNLNSATLTLIERIDCVVFSLAFILSGIALLRMHFNARKGAIIVIITRFVTVIPLMYFIMKDQSPWESFGSHIADFYNMDTVILSVYLIFLRILISLLYRPSVKSAFARV